MRIKARYVFSLVLLTMLLAFPMAENKAVSIIPAKNIEDDLGVGNNNIIFSKTEETGNSRIDTKLARVDRITERNIDKILERHRIPEVIQTVTKVVSNENSDMEPRWSIPENITIEDNVTIWQDGNKTIADKILIIDNATLILYNFTLIMSASDYGKVGIVLLNHSTLILNYSTITYDPISGYQYYIWVEANSTLQVLNGSLIEYAGWSPAHPGIEVGLNYTTIGEEAVVEIVNSTIKDCYNGLTLVGKVNVTIENSVFQDIAKYGISVDRASKVDITNTNFIGGETAIYIYNGNVDVYLSTFSGSTSFDIIGETTATITIGNSTFTNGGGIKIGGSTATIENNTFTGTTYGIYVTGTSGSVTIDNNEISDSLQYGILIEDSTKITVTNNKLTNTYILINGTGISAFNTHTITGNTVDGKPVYYLTNSTNPSIPTDGGEYIIANCTGIQISNVEFNGLLMAFEIAYSNFTIAANFTNNLYGLYIVNPADGAMISSRFTGNTYGVFVKDASLTKSIIYGSYFTKNIYGVYMCYSTATISNSVFVNDTIFLEASTVVIDNSFIGISLEEFTGTHMAIYADSGSSLTVSNTQIMVSLVNATSGGYPEEICAIYSLGNLVLNNVDLKAYLMGSSRAVPVVAYGTSTTIKNSNFYGEAYNSSITYLVEIWLASNVLIDHTNFTIYGYDRRYKEFTEYYLEALDLGSVGTVVVNNSYFFVNVTGNSTVPGNFTDFCDDYTIPQAQMIWGQDIASFAMYNSYIDAWVYWLGTIYIFEDYKSSASNYYIENTDIYLHAWGGPNAEVFDTYKSTASISLNNTRIYLDLYGYGETIFYYEDDEPVYAEPYWFFAVAAYLYKYAYLEANNTLINVSARGFGYGIVFILAISDMTMNNVNWYIYGTDDATVIGCVGSYTVTTFNHVYFNIKGYGASYFYGLILRGSMFNVYHSTIYLESYADSYIPAFINTQNWRYIPCFGIGWVWYGPSYYWFNDTIIKAVGSIPLGINAVNQTFVSVDYSSFIGFSTGINLFWNCSANIMNSEFLNNTVAVHLGFSTANISKNTFTNTRETNIEIFDSYDAIVENNYLGDTSLWGMAIGSSVNITVKNNVFDKSGILITGENITHFNSHTIEGNTINGKPILYYVGESGITIDTTFGELILVDCGRITVSGPSPSEADVGIEIAFSSDITVDNADIRWVRYSIYAYSSDKITISGGYIEGGEKAIYMVGSEASIDGVLINSSSVGIVAEDNSILTISDIEIVNSGSAIQGTASTITIEDSTITSDTYGIKVIAGSDLTIDRLTITDIDFEAVHAVGSDVVVMRTNIQHSSTGIKIESSTLGVYESTIANNTDYGVHALESIFTMRNVTITQNGYGIYATKTVGDIKYSNIYRNALHGIYNTGPEPQYYIEAYYVYWGSMTGPEYTAYADEVDPEEIYGYVIWADPLIVGVGETPRTATATTTTTTTAISVETIYSSVAYISPAMMLGMSIVPAVIAFAIIFLMAKRARAVVPAKEE